MDFDKLLEEIEEQEERDGVYYRLKYNEDTNRIVVCCMQWFDECDYDQSKFITEKKFLDEKKAQELATYININGFDSEIIAFLGMFKPLGGECR